MKIASWNIRTLMDVRTPSDDDRPPRRTALVAAELKKYDIDVAALSETRFAGEGSLTEVGQGYTFFWKGLAENDQRIHGVGLAVKTDLLNKIPETPVGISERIMSLRIPLTSSKYLTLISCYAPTLNSPEDVKDRFYEQLDQILSATPHSDKITLLGDFNARVGSNYAVWGGIIGRHGLGKVNANGLRLLNLCATHNLCITNTTFQLANKYKTTWMHPRSKHWHQIDFIITRKRDLQDFIITKALRGAECWTDHRLLRSVVKFTVRPPIRKQARKKKLNTSLLKDTNKLSELRGNLAAAIEQIPKPTSHSKAEICEN